MESKVLDVIFVFADDSRQRTPTRPGLGPLVAIGGLFVPADSLRELEANIQAACVQIGFPEREEFKWSPSRGSWMYDNLVSEERQSFFLQILDTAREAGSTAAVVIEDSGYSRATNAPTHEADVTQMFLERITWALNQEDGIVVVDRPGGDQRAEEKFLSQCLDAIQSSAEYIRPEKIAINVLCTSSHLVRVLQLADLLTSSTVAFIAGEQRYSPPIFESVKPMLHNELGRVGGVGVKIHPDFRYANLYHWLLGDEHFVRYPTGVPLPMRERPYNEGPENP